MRRIFEYLQYPAGFVYKNRGIHYAVTSVGSPTYFLVTRDDETKYYFENLQGIYPTNSDLIDHELTPLDEAETAELSRLFRQALIDDALELGLLEANSSDIPYPLMVMLVEHLRYYPHDDPNEILASHHTAKPAYQHNSFFELVLSAAQSFAISKDQYEYLRDLSKAAPENDFKPSIEFEKIKNLSQKHQIAALRLGLSAEQAAQISAHQCGYLLKNHNPETGVQGLQDNFERIKNLRLIHQIVALDLGFTQDQAVAIHPYESQYLSRLSQAIGSQFSSELAQRTLQQINSLEPRQKDAFRFGVSLPDATNLSEDDFEKIAVIQGRKPISKNPEENLKEYRQRIFFDAYQMFTREVTTPNNSPLTILHQHSADTNHKGR
jgi:hypothetical protein